MWCALATWTSDGAITLCMPLQFKLLMSIVSDYVVRNADGDKIVLHLRHVIWSSPSFIQARTIQTDPFVGFDFAEASRRGGRVTPAAAGPAAAAPPAADSDEEMDEDRRRSRVWGAVQVASAIDHFPSSLSPEKAIHLVICGLLHIPTPIRLGTSHFDFAAAELGLPWDGFHSLLRPPQEMMEWVEALSEAIDAGIELDGAPPDGDDMDFGPDGLFHCAKDVAEACAAESRERARAADLAKDTEKSGGYQCSKLASSMLLDIHASCSKSESC